MSNFLNYSLSVDKGLFGNIGKMTLAKKWNDEPFMSVMLFLSSNNEEHVIADGKKFQPQIINVHFPEETFPLLEQFGVGDLVRVRV